MSPVEVLIGLPYLIIENQQDKKLSSLGTALVVVLVLVQVQMITT